MGRQIELSHRMQTIAGLVTPGLRVCDVGCDHGFISIYLIQQAISPYVIAMDVNRGPLQTAKTHVAGYGLEHQIELRLSDGVHQLTAGEAEALICAGMGGRLIRRILEEGWEKLSHMQEWILQPQSEIGELREYLYQKGCLIAEEEMVKEDGKYYVILKVLPQRQAVPGQAGEGKPTSYEMVYGPVLLKRKHPVLREFLQQEELQCQKILEALPPGEGRRENRRQEILQRMDEIHRAQACFADGC